jgi:hypothetical protein
MAVPARFAFEEAAMPDRVDETVVIGIGSVAGRL